jgi:hypothetical protein
MPTLVALGAAALLAAPPAPPESLSSLSSLSRERVEAEAFRVLGAIAAGEPSIAAVQSAAARVAAAGLPAAGSFARRARLAALLPRLTAEIRHDERSQRIVGLQGAGEVDYLRLSPGTQVALRATWDLGHLAAAPGELGGAAAGASRARRQEEAVRRATSLYYERRKLRLALWLDPPAEALARAQGELELDRLGAELDALTGGLVSREAR